MKRVFLLIATNLAVIVVLGIVWNILDSIFGISQIFIDMGLPAHFGYVALMALVLGFGGAFISLWMSKWMAKRSMGVQIIEHPQNNQERWLIETVQRQADAVGIKMPEVGIFHSPDPNAFATGARKNEALVAVSQGLLEQMTSDEVEAVLGHELSHIANGDMVTQTLLQGVLNTFVIFFARVIGYLVDSFLSRGEENEGGMGIGYFVTSIIMDILLGFLASLIVMRFSRSREFHADIGGAKLAGTGKMISALKRLQQVQSGHDLPGEMAAFGIAGGVGEGMKKLMMTHPPLEERIAALQKSESTRQESLSF
jgi:heat shock protein HtpX